MSREPAKPARATQFLPTYVGSKLSWLPRLGHLRGRPFVELFAGSAVLSANLASSALLVEKDPMVARILARFDEQIVYDTFTREDFFRVRGRDDWWRYAYCLQSMSFSGVFRYSSRGYNVPHKGGGDLSRPGTAPAYEALSLRPRYEAALARWRELQPEVHATSYSLVPDRMFPEDAVVVFDPPYEGSQAAYNAHFDYGEYWDRVHTLRGRHHLLVFDTLDNLRRQGLPVTGTRSMRVNGARPGGVEALSELPVSSRTPQTAVAA